MCSLRFLGQFKAFEFFSKMLSKTIYNNLDIYEEPCNPMCRGLVILTTYCIDKDLTLPNFIDVEKEITDDPKYSMYNMSKKINKP